MLDLYVVLAGVRDDTAELRITFNPLVVWVWIGGMVMAIGGLIVMWPQAERRRAPSGYVAMLAPGTRRRAGAGWRMNRRSFFGRAGAVRSRLVLACRSASRRRARRRHSNASNLFDMDQDAAQAVRRPAKPGAHPSMTDDERDDLEHQIRCQCGCTLDVYTCRTTDFSCEVSPAMHRDVMSLVEGGYSAQEILDAFVDTYGERALMAPRRAGFQPPRLPRAVRRAGRRCSRRGGRAARLGEPRRAPLRRCAEMRVRRTNWRASTRRFATTPDDGALILGTVLALTVLGFVLAPVVMGVRRSTVAQRVLRGQNNSDLSLAALREIEFDRATG